MDSGFGTVAGLVLVVVGGIIVPGLANYALSSLGYGTLGSALWVLGYGTMAVLLWYGWIRRLDLSGPRSSLGATETDAGADDGSAEGGDETSGGAN